MKTILLFTNHPEEHHAFTFDLEGHFKSVVVNKRIDEKMFRELCKVLPWNEQELNDLVNRLKAQGIKCLTREVPADLSFNTFYNQYGVKRNKERALKLWDKLPDSEKVRAMQFIQRYSALCRNDGIKMKYPDTYLTNRTWND